MYIYEILCLVNGYRYIGQTKDFKARKQSHINRLKRGNHDNYRLQEDYNLYGLSNFKFNILEECDKIEANNREDYYISKFGESLDDQNVYNMKNNKHLNKELISTLTETFNNGCHANKFKGLTHEQIYGKETAEKMRIANSQKHKGKKVDYIPYRNKVKSLDGNMIEVTEELIRDIKDLYNKGFTIDQISEIKHIGKSGIFNIVHNRLFCQRVTTNPDECKDVE